MFRNWHWIERLVMIICCLTIALIAVAFLVASVRGTWSTPVRTLPEVSSVP